MVLHTHVQFVDEKRSSRRPVRFGIKNRTMDRSFERRRSKLWVQLLSRGSSKGCGGRNEVTGRHPAQRRKAFFHFLSQFHLFLQSTLLTGVAQKTGTRSVSVVPSFRECLFLLPTCQTLQTSTKILGLFVQPPSLSLVKMDVHGSLNSICNTLYCFRVFRSLSCLTRSYRKFKVDNVIRRQSFVSSFLCAM